MIAVDANIVAYFVIHGDKTAEAQELWRRDPQWRLPPLWRDELLNVFTNYVRFADWSLSSAWELFAQAEGLFQHCEVQPKYESSLKIAAQAGITAYDAQYVQVAIELGVPLITEDRKLREATPTVSRSMASFLSLS